MSWVTPSPVTTGDLITAADWNQDVVDNTLALKDPPTDSYVGNDSADWTTTSTSFVDIDATDLGLAITTTGGDVMIGFHGNISGSTTLRAYLDVTMDGTAIAGDDGIIAVNPGTAVASGAVSFVRLVTSVAAGAHTFVLRWKVNTGTATLYAGAGTSTADLHLQFWVREVS
jgi:hypothetical protein